MKVHLIPLALLTALALGCTTPPMRPPRDVSADNWHPSPNGKWALEIIDRDGDASQSIRLRNADYPERDGVIDDLVRPGSLLWSPTGDLVVINHRDDPAFHHFEIFTIDRGVPTPHPEWLRRSRNLWARLHTQPMSRVSFRGTRFEREGRSLLIIATGDPVNAPGEFITDGILLDFTLGTVRHVSDPDQLIRDWQGR